MSRMGHRPIELPSEVEVKVSGDTVTASGPEGELSETIPRGIEVEVGDDAVHLERADDSRRMRSQHGLLHSLIRNMVRGVHDPFTKTLELNGLGYRVNKQGETLHFELGYSDPIRKTVPEDLEVEIPNNTTVVVRGIDKQAVGEFASQLRQLRNPDPYNQKGIKYEDEEIRQKVGKAVGGGEEMGPGGEGASDSEA